MSENQNDDGKSEIDPVYYYSREHRLKRASKTVREFNESGPEPGVLRRIAGNRGNIFLLVSILIVCVMFVLTSKTREPETLKLGGNNITLSVIDSDGALVFTIEKFIPDEEAVYTGAVDVVISPVQKKPEPGKENPPPELITDRFFFTLEPQEVFALPLTFTGDEFIVILQAEEERLVRKLRPRKEAGQK